MKIRKSRRRRVKVSKLTTLPRRGRWKLPLVIIAIVAVVVGLVWLVGFSTVLSVRQVTVEGTSLLDAEQVVDVAQVPMGEPLLRVDAGGIEARVTELAPVKKVDVSRAWPSTIRIVVTERTTRFIADDGVVLTAVDETGVGFTTVESPPKGAIVADGVPPEEWPDVSIVVGALPPKVAEVTETVTTRGPDAIVLHLADGVTVEWGSADDSAEKALVISALMKGAPDAKTYNVSAPGHPTTK